jgi:RHS repeat-associated protein
VYDTGIIEKDNGTVTTSKKYLWDGEAITEERDSTGATAIKKFYSQGFVDTDNTNLYYTRDHLGSIRELTGSTQAIRARYDYDPYGRMTKVSGDRDSVFLYTGHLWHMQSSLYLTMYRAYDPNLGRWITRDPIQERGGLNLYKYALNQPTLLVDRDGLMPENTVKKAIEVCLLLAPCARLDCLKQIIDGLYEADPSHWQEWMDKINKLDADLANKLNHVFQAKHNFDPLLNEVGSQQSLYDMIYRNASQAYQAGNLPAGTTVTMQINGYTVYARGAMVNGQFAMSTAYVKQ